MTYARVIPRDLFNEGDLLNCLGRLWIKLDERRDHRALLEHSEGHTFVIIQDPSDGSISCSTVALAIYPSQQDRAANVDARLPWLFRPLNARSKWPLWCRMDDVDVRVFDEDTGELSAEFWDLIKAEGDCPHCGGDGLEPVGLTHDAGDGEGEDVPCHVCNPR